MLLLKFIYYGNLPDIPTFESIIDFIDGNQNIFEFKKKTVFLSFIP